MAADEKQEQDEVDALLDADPRAHVAESGDAQVWLLSGDDQLKAAREALPKTDQ